MGNNILSSSFFLYKKDYNELEISLLKSELTHRDYESNAGFGKNQLIFFFEEDDNYLIIPRQYAKRFGNYIDKRNKDNSWDYEYKWNPEYNLLDIKERDQVSFVKKIESVLLKDDIGALGTADPGFGKTVCGAYLANQFKLNTIIVSDKEFLINQWKKSFKKCLGIDCGVVRQKTCKYKGYPVVLAYQKSLFSREYPKEFYDYFSFLILDEAHHLTANTWWKGVNKFSVHYMLALTATPGQNSVAKDNFLLKATGPISGYGKLVTDRVTVFKIDWYQYIYRTKYAYHADAVKYRLDRLIRCIASDSDRNKRIANDVCQAALSGRKILIVSHLIEHIDDLKSLIIEKLKSKKKWGWYSGEMVYNGIRRKMTQEEREKNADECDILGGTWKMVEEGLDIPSLDTLFICTPKKEIRQIVGRIQRPFPNKKKPYVIDYVDSRVPDLDSINEGRMSFYRGENFLVHHITPK